MKSKVLKKFRVRKQPKNILSKILCKIYDFFVGNPIWKIKQTCAALKRFFAYGKMGWRSYDWDYLYLLILIRFKLFRMLTSLETGFKEQEEQTIKSLRICIKLLDRLTQGDYDYWLTKHYTKWGYPDFEFVESETNDILGPMKIMIDKRNQNRNEAEKNQEKEEFLVAYHADEKHKSRDAKLLFSVMNKYHTSWWD
jgi:hypothetical protein